MTDNTERYVFAYKLTGRFFYNFAKRIIDITGAVLGLLIFSPVLLVLGILIRKESTGPAIFKQIRTGRYGKPFTMYKLRTMVINAEELKKELLPFNEQDLPAFKMENDPRYTKLGKKLCGSSIDEVPQLLNILLGQMSFVGPRPLPKEEADQITEYHKQRELVKPGLTCFWQAENRTRTSFNEWMELDIKYVKECSFFLDIYLIVKTFLVFFIGIFR